MSEEHQAQLAELIEEYGLHMLMQTLYGGGDVARAARKSLGTKMPKGQKRAAGRREKDRLVQRCNEEYPDWNVGDGKGYRVTTLRKALDNGEEPQKTPLSGYMVFMQHVRPQLKEGGFKGKFTAVEGGKRWRALSPEDKLDYINQGRDDVGLPPKELEETSAAAPSAAANVAAEDSDSDEDSTPAANTRSKKKVKKVTKPKAKGGGRKKATPKAKGKGKTKGGRGRGRKKTPPQKEATPPANNGGITGMFDSDSSDSD